MVAPTPPVILTASPEVIPLDRESSTSYSDTLALVGTAIPNSTITVFDGATQLGTVTTDSSGATVFAATATVNVSYQFAVQPGLNDTSNDLAWQILGQFHADDNDPIYNSMSEGSPPFAFHLTGPNGIGQGDYLSIQALYA